MNNELIIDASEDEVNIALLSDKKLVELNKEGEDDSFSVGDIYLAKVRKVMAGLNAAFVDVGYEKDGFLHYLDLGPQIRSLNKFVKDTISGKQKHANLMYFKQESDINKDGKITEVVSTNQLLLVQVAKEPISTKGPRITTELSIAGRYLVLVPFSDRISVSSKVRKREEKARLKRLIQSIKPKNFGVIVRTVAEGKSVADLDADLKDLTEKWKRIFDQLVKAQKPPVRVLGEISRTSVILRDLLNESFNSIHINENELFEQTKKFLSTIAPEKEKIAKFYAGKEPIFEHFGIDRQIKALFGKTVNMKSGAYLIVEHTEALHVIDVNSGHRAKSNASQEENALEVNLEAAAEIARMLRLRDMGGIIVCDFIDMHSAQNRKLLFEKIKEEMRRDRAKHNILPPSKFGLIQITRQRVRPEMNIITSEKCPCCSGSGDVESTLLFADKLENAVRYTIKELKSGPIILKAHPYVAAYLTKKEGRIFSTTLVKKWMKQFGQKISVKPMNKYSFLEFHIYNEKGEEVY